MISNLRHHSSKCKTFLLLIGLHSTSFLINNLSHLNLQEGYHRTFIRLLKLPDSSYHNKHTNNLDISLLSHHITVNLHSTKVLHHHLHHHKHLQSTEQVSLQTIYLNKIVNSNFQATLTKHSIKLQHSLLTNKNIWSSTWSKNVKTNTSRKNITCKTNSRKPNSSQHIC